ncbi:MAG: hypothetical protein K2N90_05260 [Lachnospiraceae bacterium]|nr:hypothetical protein [Lachnospiraceae bacterium]
MKNSRRDGLLLLLIIVLFMGYLCHSMTRNMQQQDNSFDSVVHVEEYSERQESTVIPISTEVSASTDTSEQEKTETDMSKPEKVKDGTIYEMLMSGNFECLGNDEARKKEIERVYQIMTKNGTAVWRQIDINGDGTDDLILQETYENWGNRKAIAGIFDCKEGQEKCVFWDINDYSEFMFCGATGELMYYAPHYGGVLSMEPYTHYYYDSEWNRIEDYTIVAYRIEATENEPIGEDWIETYPDMAESGDYYRLYMGADQTGKALTFEEFVEIYETETGFAFQNDSYSPWK